MEVQYLLKIISSILKNYNKELGDIKNEKYFAAKGKFIFFVPLVTRANITCIKAKALELSRLIIVSKVR